MKALTICQPYAHLIAIGEKPIENRSWETPYRGTLAIHAGRSRDWMTAGDAQRYPDLVFGAVVAVARLVACLAMSRSVWPEPFQELREHEHANGPWCWVLEDVRRLKRPVYCQGAQGLWIPFDDAVRAIKESP
jgi:hypothetical protein